MDTAPPALTSKEVAAEDRQKDVFLRWYSGGPSQRPPPPAAPDPSAKSTSQTQPTLAPPAESMSQTHPTPESSIPQPSSNIPATSPPPRAPTSVSAANTSRPESSATDSRTRPPRDTRRKTNPKRTHSRGSPDNYEVDSPFPLLSGKKRQIANERLHQVSDLNKKH